MKNGFVNNNIALGCLLLLLFLNLQHLFAEVKMGQIVVPSYGEEWVSEFVNTDLDVETIDSVLDHYATLFIFDSIAYHEQCLNHLIASSIRLDYQDRLFDCYNRLGVLQRNHSLYEDALVSFQKAEQCLVLTLAYLIKNCNDIGVVYRRLDRSRLALASHLRALTLIDEYSEDPMDVDFEKGVALNSIGNINLSLEQPDKALDFFLRSLDLELKRKNTLGLAINYQNIGFVYQSMGNVSEALNYYKKSLHENQLVHSAMGMSICFNSIGDVYLQQDNYARAKAYFDSAYVYSSTLSDMYHATQTYGNLARVYLKMEDFDAAKVYLQLFFFQSYFTHSLALKYEANMLYSNYYEIINMSDSALYYYKQAVLFNDSIVNKRNSNYLNEQQTIYETQEQEQQIGLLTAENRIKEQRVILFIATSLVLVMILIVAFLFYNKRRIDNMQREEVLRQQLLRSQMNPHFLFNALGRIQHFMLKNDAKMAASYLNNFASLTRSILEHSSQELIPLSEEIETLNNYIKLEQMRLQHSFDYVIECDADLETEFINIPPMFIQPFVENAIKHGLKNLAYKGNLKIVFEEGKGKLNIQVIDNGVGISHAKNTIGTHRSMSMKIFEDRRKVFSYRNNKQVEFSIKDLKDIEGAGSGTSVFIEIPIRN